MDPQEQAPPAASPPEPTPGDKSRAERDASFEKRQEAARNRSRPGAEPADKVAPAADDQPTAKPKDEPKPEPKAEDKKPSEVDKRHAIAERREKRVAARESKIQTREDAVEKRERESEAKFGDPDAAVKEYDAKNYHAAARYIQRIFKDDFATITQKVARATAGFSAEKLKELEDREDFARKKREFDEEKTKAEEEKNRGATRAQAVQTVAQKVTGHDVLKLRNGADLVLKELESSWDPVAKGFKVTFKQAADKVVADKLAEAEALGARRVKATIEDKPATKAEPAKQQRRVVREVAKPKDGKRPTFEERHALAGRVTARRRG